MKLRESEHETYPVASDGDIFMTETALGRPLPSSFKAFVRSFSNGAYLYMLQEVSAVGEGNQKIAAIQKIYRNVSDPDENLSYHEGGQTTFKYLVPFGLDHNGNEWCFITDSAGDGNEYPVAYFETTRRKLYGKLPGFTEWLSILVERQEEVIRTLYDEDFQNGQMGLG
jgi:hypothetical protein